ncbi:Hypothetical protein NTJ_07671 [Nesidiocoris tenuis]|uniref:Gustatory receptor n=1 Tax=Nesidiocoris tenuis TaxID=355587 RepID=A0ABN7AU29_9HEMI|nr:Hypothetical protein NTJ_07671 [Nesidiocoris tenuis]
MLLRFMDGRNGQNRAKSMMHAIWILQRGLEIVGLVHHAIGNVRHRIKLTDIFKALKACERNSDRLNNIHLMIITLNTVAMIYLIQSIDWTALELLELSCCLIPTYASLLIVLQFCSLCSRFSSRLIKVADDIRMRGVIDHLKHANLVELADDTIRIYGVQLLINCATTFCTIVSSAYSCYTWGVIEKAPKPPFARIAILLLFIALRFISIFFLTRASERIRADADRFNLELFSIMREKKELCDNDIMSIYVSVRPSITVTACKFFVIGHPLLTSINAAASTYLVILIQFSSSS